MSTREPLSRQAGTVAARLSRQPSWQTELAERSALESGRDKEPRVNAGVVREVSRALNEPDRPSDAGRDGA
jgi:hypothetical protein